MMGACFVRKDSIIGASILGIVWWLRRRKDGRLLSGIDVTKVKGVSEEESIVRCCVRMR